MRAIVSHDAGGAEVLSSYVRAHPAPSCYVLGGPARQVFERKLGPLTVSTISAALETSDELLCGTGWQSTLEIDAIAHFRTRGMRTVAFLDHWVNYAERFVRNGQLCLPDEIWVGDSDAERLAVAAFPSTVVRLEPNLHFQEVRQEFLAIAGGGPLRTTGTSVLYVTEPIREHGKLKFGDERYFGYTEEDSLRYFLSNSAAVDPWISSITIRSHPAESAGKYRWALTEFSLPIVEGGSRALVSEIADADMVVGCESMALVVALLGGKRVVSCIPPGGHRCALPHREIEHLQDLLVTHGSPQGVRVSE
ncbi:MAG: hypothetical protein NTZ43_02510 [Gemmatimonadetes bacterium]|nr:hypothetical protein [Gemmatimonadota bacterium]